MKIAVGCDHTVYETKQLVIDKLLEMGHEVIDCGPYDKVRTHYPIYGRTVGLHVAEGRADLGVAICGTGIGISNSANKVKGIRCMVVRDIYTARKAKEQYNANVISCGGRIVGCDSVVEIVTTFLKAKYNNSHKKEINLIDNQIKVLNNDPELFTDIIEKWEAGGYTNNDPQKQISIPTERVLKK